MTPGMETAVQTESELKPTPIAKLLEQLSNLFDDELERQELVLAVCCAQGEAARAHDANALEARTRSLATLMDDALGAERRRVGLLRDIVEHFSLPVELQTLSDLIRVVPEPWHRRMKEFQERIRATLAQTRSIVRENAAYMRRSLKSFNHTLDGLTGEPTTPAGSYTAEGDTPVRETGTPAVIDARG